MKRKNTQGQRQLAPLDPRRLPAISEKKEPEGTFHHVHFLEKRHTIVRMLQEERCVEEASVRDNAYAGRKVERDALSREFRRIQQAAILEEKHIAEELHRAYQQINEVLSQESPLSTPHVSRLLSRERTHIFPHDINSAAAFTTDLAPQMLGDAKDSDELNFSAVGSPLLSTSFGRVLQLLAVDISFEILADTCLLVHTTQWTASTVAGRGVAAVPIVAYLPNPRGSQLVSLSFDFGISGVAESVISTDASLNSPRVKPGVSAFVEVGDASYSVVPLRDVGVSETIKMKAVYRVSAVTATPATEEGPSLWEFRFPNAFPACCFDRDVSFDNIATFGAVILGLSHRGLEVFSHPAATVYKSSASIGARSTCTILHREPGSGLGCWFAGSDVVVSYRPQRTKESQCLLWAEINPFTERCESSLSLLVPSADGVFEEDCTTFRQRLHICIDKAIVDSMKDDVASLLKLLHLKRDGGEFFLSIADFSTSRVWVFGDDTSTPDSLKRAKPAQHVCGVGNSESPSWMRVFNFLRSFSDTSPMEATFGQWIIWANSTLQSAKLEATFAADCLRDVILMCRSEIPLEEQESTAKYFHCETGTARLHTIWVGDDYRTQSSSRSFCFALCERTGGRFVTPPTNKLFRESAWIFCGPAPTVQSSVFSFTGCSRTEGTQQTILGNEPAVTSSFALFLSTDSTCESAQLVLQLAKSRRVTRRQACGRTPLPITMFQARRLVIAATASAWWSILVNRDGSQHCQERMVWSMNTCFPTDISDVCERSRPDSPDPCECPHQSAIVLYLRPRQTNEVLVVPGSDLLHPMVAKHAYAAYSDDPDAKSLPLRTATPRSDLKQSSFGAILVGGPTRASSSPTTLPQRGRQLLARCHDDLRALHALIEEESRERAVVANAYLSTWVREQQYFYDEKARLKRNRSRLFLSLAEIDHRHKRVCDAIVDEEDRSWQQLLEETEERRIILSRVNTAAREARRRVIYTEEDERILLLEDQQRVATVAALVVASLGRGCPSGEELRSVYPYVARGLRNGDGGANVHYLLGVIDHFHNESRAIAFLKCATAIWSARDSCASRMLASDGGVDRCKDMIFAYGKHADVIESVLSTVSSLAAIRTNHSKLGQSGIVLGVMKAMSLHPSDPHIQAAAARALQRLSPLSPSAVAVGGLSLLLTLLPFHAGTESYCLHVFSVVLSVVSAVPATHMFVASAGIPPLAAVALFAHSGSEKLLYLLLDICGTVASERTVRAVLVSSRSAVQAALRALLPHTAQRTKMKALECIRKLAGNVMEPSSVLLCQLADGALRELLRSEKDEQLRTDCRSLIQRLNLKRASAAVGSDGSRLVVPASVFTVFASSLPPELATRLLPWECLKLSETSPSEGTFGVVVPCSYTCPATGVVRSAVAQVFDQEILCGAESTPEEKASTLRAAVTIMQSDIARNSCLLFPPFSLCVGFSVGETNTRRIFCTVFESNDGSPLRPLPRSRESSLMFVEVAHALFAALVALEHAGLVHGHISPAAITLDKNASDPTSTFCIRLPPLSPASDSLLERMKAIFPLGIPDRIRFHEAWTPFVQTPKTSADDAVDVRRVLLYLLSCGDEDIKQYSPKRQWREIPRLRSQDIPDRLLDIIFTGGDDGCYLHEITEIWRELHAFRESVD